MKRYALCLLLLVFASGVFLAEYAGAIEIYTFKKERVDQDLDGNRGYIMGTPPSRKNMGSRKRTLIGVDIELAGGSDDSLLDEDASIKSDDQPVFTPVAQTVVCAPDGVRSEVIEISSQGEEIPKNVDIQEEIIIEEEWIK